MDSPTELEIVLLWTSWDATRWGLRLGRRLRLRQRGRLDQWLSNRRTSCRCHFLYASITRTRDPSD
jgi:hypothetical protein